MTDILIILRNGVVDEVYSHVKDASVKVLDIDDQADDPVILNEQNVRIPDGSLQDIVDEEFEKFYN